MTVWTSATWLDGPAFMEWVFTHYSRGELRAMFGEGRLRRTRDWQNGGKVHYGAADRFLTVIGMHLSEVPEEVWL